VEIKVLNEEKNVLEFEIVGEDSTLPEILVHKLNQMPEVDFAAYKIDHPLVGSPKIFLRTKKGAPAAAIHKAVEALVTEIAEFREGISKFKA
jgi:DNA-directed RNA polymerase subunit L